MLSHSVPSRTLAPHPRNLVSSDRSRKDENGRYSRQHRSLKTDEASESNGRLHDRSRSRNGRVMSPESSEGEGNGSRKSASGTSDARSGQGEEERRVETGGGSGTEGDVSRQDRAASVVGVSGSPVAKMKKRLVKYRDRKSEISRRDRVASFDAVSVSPSEQASRKRPPKRDDGVEGTGDTKGNAEDGTGLNGDIDEIISRKRKKKKRVVIDTEDTSLTSDVGPAVTPRGEGGVLRVQVKAAAVNRVVKKEREPTPEENDLINDLRGYLTDHHVRCDLSVHFQLTLFLSGLFHLIVR